MAQHFNWTKAFVYSVGLVGSGYLIMRTTTPTEEQIYQRLSPELKKRADEFRKEQPVKQHQLVELLKQNMESDKPVWEAQPLKTDQQERTNPNEKS
ncbi:assembly factor cbp4 [Dispira parvispora]|uniref:Cytochrome b mRNA-processing protein 4 n=1 Tax=Dispira parvispora TaxID=1520584 RepID=A0A9W8AIX6_9FUNG|nr:assembly factor cbp4 [Dispira parvispora]